MAKSIRTGDLNMATGLVGSRRPRVNQLCREACFVVQASGERKPEDLLALNHLLDDRLPMLVIFHDIIKGSVGNLSSHDLDALHF